MKIKNLFGVLSLAVVAAGGMALGLAEAPAQEAKAGSLPPDTAYIYLDNSNWYEGNERYAAYFFTDENEDGDAEAEEWVDFEWDEDLYYNKVRIPNTAYEKVVLCRMNGSTEENNWDNRWNEAPAQDNHTGIFKPYARNEQKVKGSWEYVLTVGETTTYMVPCDGQLKVHRTVTAVAGANVSLKADGDSEPGTLNPETKHSNNMTADYKVKVAGEVTFTVTKSGWSTWASGYAPADTKLQDFCDNLLDLACDAKDLSGLDWDGLGEDNQAAFNNASVVPGNEVTYVQYGSVLNEAATRYALLVAKGATPITGVTVNVLNISNNNVQNNNAPIIVILASVSVLLVVGISFAIIKKRHN